MTRPPSRPFRAALLLGGAVALWLVARVPQMRERLALAEARLHPARQVAMHPRPPGHAPAALPAEIPPPPLAMPPSEARWRAASIRSLVPRPPLAPETHAIGGTATRPSPTPAQVADGSGLGGPPTPPPLPTTPPPPLVTPAWQLADQAYAALRRGDRRGAVTAFDAALASDPDNRQWRADRAALTRRWQGEAFLLERAAGLTGPTVAPLLGGGQAAASLRFTPDPLARRPVALVARVLAATGDNGLAPDTAQAAIGVRWQVTPAVSLSAERLQKLGENALNGWTLRLAGGVERRRLSAYGELGVLASGEAYGGAQARVEAVRLGPVSAGGGAWAGFQTGTPDAARVDVGPSLRLPLGKVAVQADWRFRVAGNAAPGSGPAVTVSGAF